MYLSPKTTSRLTIRPLTENDIPAWAAFFVHNPGLRFFNLDDGLRPEEKARYWIQRQLGRYKNNLFGLMALVETKTGELIGQCGLLVQEVNGQPEIEIGYHVLPKHWGMSFAPEAAQFFKQYAFDNKLAGSVISIITTENTNSQRVAENNGMAQTVQTEFQQKPVFIYRVQKSVAVA